MGDTGTRRECTFLDTVQDYLDDRLSPSSREEFEAHLAGCADCRRELEDMRRVQQVLAQAAEQPLPGISKTRVASRLFGTGQQPSSSTWAQRWWLPALAASAAVVLVILITLWPGAPDGVRPRVPDDDGSVRTAGPTSQDATPQHRVPARRVLFAFSPDAGAERRARQDGGTEVILEQGGCYVLITPPVAGRYLVRTPAGSVEATGTSFAVRVLDSDRTGVWLFEGSLRLRPRQGRAFSIRAPAAVLLERRSLPRSDASPKHRAAAVLAHIRRLLATRKIDRARRELEAYLAHRPGDPRAVFLLADAHRLDGKTNEALRLYLQVAKERAGSHGLGEQTARLAEAALYQAGRLQLEELKRPAEALGTFERALREHPRGLLRQEVLYQLAACRLALGEYEQAVDAFERYLRAYPHGTKADEARTLLQALREKGWR